MNVKNERFINFVLAFVTFLKVRKTSKKNVERLRTLLSDKKSKKKNKIFKKIVES